MEAKAIADCPFIVVEPVRDQKSVMIFRKVTGLDAGESEATVMAEENHADLLLMDERKGRQVAKQMGLSLTGTVGILLQAYDEQLLSANEVELCLEKMKLCGIRISDALCEMVREHIEAPK